MDDLLFRDRAFAAVFLTRDQLPDQLDPFQDQRLAQLDDPDGWFAAQGGVRFGIDTWQAAEMELPVWRVMDLRWLFRTPAEATAFHHTRFLADSESLPEIVDAPPVGLDSHAYLGVSHMLLPVGLSIVMGCYLFTGGPIRLKIFASEGRPGAGLAIGYLHDLARQAEARASELLSQVALGQEPTDSVTRSEP